MVRDVDPVTVIALYGDVRETVRHVHDFGRTLVLTGHVSIVVGLNELSAASECDSECGANECEFYGTFHFSSPMIELKFPRQTTTYAKFSYFVDH